MKKEIKEEKRIRRVKRVRAKIVGSAVKPRLCVFRSLNHISGQIINDEENKTMIFSDDKGLKGSKIEKAAKVGELLAVKAIEKGIKEVVFDKRGYKYHGRVKSLAEGARKGGLKF